jgi:DNA-binding NarL/FixJ family response regulator
MSTINLLIIEDNPGDVRLLKEMLAASSEHGVLSRLEIEVVDRLSDGLQVLNSKSIDILILDPGLPDSTGFATYQAVRSLHPDLSIIIVTGNHEQDIGPQFVTAGAQDFIVKGLADRSMIIDTVVCTIENGLKHDLNKAKGRFLAITKKSEEERQNPWIDSALHNEVFKIASDLGWTCRNIVSPNSVVVDFVVYKEVIGGDISLLHQQDLQNRPDEMTIEAFLKTRDPKEMAEEEVQHDEGK